MAKTGTWLGQVEMMRAVAFELTSCLSKLSKLGPAVAAVGKTLSSGKQEKRTLLSRVFCALQLVPAMSATGIAKA